MSVRCYPISIQNCIIPSTYLCDIRKTNFKINGYENKNTEILRNGSCTDNNG